MIPKVFPNFPQLEHVRTCYIAPLSRASSSDLLAVFLDMAQPRCRESAISPPAVKSEGDRQLSLGGLVAKMATSVTLVEHSL